MLESKEYPKFVKAVYGGMEECPDTKRQHFQGALNTNSVRFSQVKNWLPKAHIELARNKEALKKYVMKEETSIGDKVIRDNERKFMTIAQALTIVAKHVYGKEDIYAVPPRTYSTMYWSGVMSHLEEQEEDISLFSQPQLERAWKNTWIYWIQKIHKQISMDAEADSITAEGMDISPQSGEIFMNDL